MSKPKQILKLEKQLGLTLPDLKKGSVLDIRNRNHYQCNDKGEVKGLNLNANQLTDISALAGLTGLQTLYLGGNNISSIKPLLHLLINQYDYPLLCQ